MGVQEELAGRAADAATATNAADAANAYSPARKSATNANSSML